MLKAIGAKLYDGNTAVRLTGVNDTTALAYASAQLLGTYSTYKYSNHNIPQYPVPGSSDSDRDCKIPSADYKEFWYKYFWILKNRLGGAINCAPPNGFHAEMSGTTKINHIRLGGHDSWGRSLQFKAFRDARQACDVMMKDMLDMAAENDIYVNLTMGGNPCDDSITHSDFGAGAIFNPGDEAYLKFVQWCADYINAYGNHPAVAGFNLFNEPTYTWFKNKYGEAIGPDGYPAWKTKMMQWKVALITDVKAKITLSPMPLIWIAGGESTIMWGIWDGHSQADIDKEKKETQDWWVADDLMCGHPYWGAEDDYLIYWKSLTENFMQKPMYIEEWGYNQTSTGEPWVSYWPWGDLEFQKYDIDECKMQLNGMPNPTGTTGYERPKLPYPGIPVPASVLDEALAAWQEYNTVPPEPTETITIDIPPYEQGSVSIPAQTVNVVIPDIQMQEQLGATTAYTLTVQLPNIVVRQQSVVVSARCHGLMHNFVVNVPGQTIVQPNLTITVPALVVKIPAQKIVTPDGIALVEGYTIKLPTIDIPPFDVEVGE